MPKATLFFVCSFVTVMCLIGSFSVYAFSVTGPGWAAGQATYKTEPVSAAGSGLSSTQLETAFIEALNAWSSVSVFNYQTSSGSADPCVIANTNPANNQNGYTFDTESCGNAFGSATVAVATTWRNNNGTGNIIQSGVVFNANKTWDIYTGSDNSAVDFRRVAIHEVGHSLGLGHSADNIAIMWFESGDTEIPQSDDLNGVESLYGVFDSDGDNIGNSVDNCPDDFNPNQEDFNSDGQGDACDNSDGDSILDDVDNCPLVNNQNQLETGSANGVGDACDMDDDAIRNDGDNCPVLYNPDQQDIDNNGVGDACDDFCFPIVATNNKLAVVCL